MKVLLDTNVVLDYVLNRPNFFRNADEVVRVCIEGGHPMLIAATTVPTTYHIAKKSSQPEYAGDIVDKVMKLFTVLSVGGETLLAARGLNGKDFEDDVQIAAALENGVHVIVTRNTADFSASPVPALTPGQFLKQFDDLRRRFP